LDRLYDAVGMNFTPSNGSTEGESDFDSVYPWSDIKLCNVVNGVVTNHEDEVGFSRAPATGDVMVEIPAFYYKIDETVFYRDFVISSVKPSEGATPDGFQLSPRHAAHAGKPGGYNNIYLGAYTCNNNYASISGNNSVVNMTRAQARNNCKGRGSGYFLEDFASFWTIALLYLVEVANLDSQRAIGQGISSGSAQAATGDADAVPWHSGSADRSSTRRAVKYRHMENLWGNIWRFVDGFNLNNPTAYVSLNPAHYADDRAANYTALAYSQIASGSGAYIKVLGFDPLFPWAQIPTDVSGADGAYVSDGFWTNTGWRVLLLGGYWGNGALDGLFTFNSNDASSNAATGLGCRLLVLP
jgi:hypothetical protein